MATPLYNLDENIYEYFEFIVKGHRYKFRQLNTEELKELQTLAKGNDEDKIQEYLFQFITKVDADTPEFPEIAKKMITKQWIKFRKMLVSEMSDEQSNKGPENTQT